MVADLARDLADGAITRSRTSDQLMRQSAADERASALAADHVAMCRREQICQTRALTSLPTRSLRRGSRAIRLEDPADVEKGIADAFAHHGPVLVDAVVARSDVLYRRP